MAIEKPLSLRSVNLNLIPILQALLREGGVSKAARVLGLSQPTVSVALAKLRAVLRDPLLVQVEGKWELTTRAQALIEPVETVCQSLEVICNPAPYDPRTAQGIITIALPDAAATVIAPPLVEALREHAPGLQLHFVDVWREFRVGQRSDEIQFLVSLPSVLAHARYGALRSARLWSDRMVTVVGSGSSRPSTGDDSGDTYSVFFPGLDPIFGEGAEFVESYTTGLPITGRFQNCSVLAILAAESGVRIKVPYTFARKMQRYMPLTIVEHDLGDAEMDVHLAWSSIFDSDPAHRWIRNLMIKSLRTLSIEGEPIGQI